jgi:hypothetical protein
VITRSSGTEIFWLRSASISANDKYFTVLQSEFTAILNPTNNIKAKPRFTSQPMDSGPANEFMRSHRLAPRRSFEPSNPLLDESLREFLRTPIHLDRDHVPKPRSPSPRSPARRVRTSLPAPAKDDDDGVDGRRRAFEQAHSLRVARELRDVKQAWKDDERFRQWRTARMSIPDSTALKREPDHRITERIVRSRNEYYMATIRGKRLPTMKDSVSPMRWIPNELRTRAKPTPRNMFHWGA